MHVQNFTKMQRQQNTVFLNLKASQLPASSSRQSEVTITAIDVVFTWVLLSLIEFELSEAPHWHNEIVEILHEVLKQHCDHV